MSVEGATQAQRQFAGPNGPKSDEQRTGQLSDMLDRAKTAAESGDTEKSNKLANRVQDAATFEGQDGTNTAAANSAYEGLVAKARRQLDANNGVEEDTTIDDVNGSGDDTAATVVQGAGQRRDRMTFDADGASRSARQRENALND